MEKVEKRRKRIINFVYFTIILGITYLFFKYCFGVFFPFLFAFLIAIIVQKPADSIVKKIKVKKKIVTTILVLLLFAIVASVISLLGMKLIDVIKSIVSFVTAKLSDLPSLIDEIKNWVINIASFLPDKFEARFIESATDWFDVLREKSASEIAATIMDSASGGEKISLSALSTPLIGLLSTVKQIPMFLVAVIICVLSSCFMAADYDWIATFVKNQLPAEQKRKLSISKKVVFKSLGNLIRSYTLIILITGTEIFIGLNILTLVGLYSGGNIAIIAVIVALLDILPVLGTGTFMIPWSLYSLITGKVGLAIGLFAVYAIIYVVRQIIEPKIVGGTVGLPSFLTLMGMYIGSQLFGFIGIFLVPILLIIVKLLNDEGVIHLWKPTDKEDDDNEEKSENKGRFSFFKKKKA